MSAAELDREFEALTEKITRERGFGCASYKDKCLRRRIAVRMRARAVHSYAAYAAVLDSDTREYDLLLDALTINVSKFFRNWETFQAIAADVIPALWGGDGRINVWSAGCAAGEEPYSLAILFHQHAAATGAPDRASRVAVLGTDIDRTSLDAAQRAEYPELAFADTPTEMRDRYFTPEFPSTVDAEVRSLVRFERHDLLTSRPPASKLDLIVCRNVIIYFDRETQERLFERFYDTLRPGGFLVLGKVETLLGALRGCFTTVNARQRIFRRPLP
ncbi:MAG: CheR family methyltransferase [Gemmatimonadaceae bacterium]